MTTTADPQAPGASIRPMTERDVAAVMRIERLSYPYPWPAVFFLRGLRSGWSCWVLAPNGVVKGYGVMRLRKGWAHIMNLCVAPACRGQGLGRRLLAHLLTVAAAEGAGRAWLEVRPDNHPAVRLYQSMGFRFKHRHPDYYRTRRGRQDALVLVRRI